ncbi:DNA polymerase III subunit gamma/tau [Adlercreutzia murintestinalis]|uniref:DNA polymerase III subunit gamma/tau n=1 Tax=Adlercreutzia murintestinalis TaxID=2941325 RepID=UPI002041D3A6|nr:DNA polymerase III subunit gamma/tau [Adlercreutzia murintestinalis]
MAEALYRKYRPQIFEDVVGQEHIERTLKNAIEADKVSHAYLFTGPRGTGKTTTARLLAKALLCEHGPTPDPDGTCEDCELVAAGEHPDVYELDAASRTGVENVREEIIGRVNYAPTRGRYKVYIIDEVHMLSTAAFNALLKTLEEPPEHVVFVLCTTDPQKVPETIHSRCQRFDFRRISNEELVSRLGAICEMEGIDFEGDALDLVAHRADGGMRDALTSLEQLIAFGEGSVTTQLAERLLGSLDFSELAEIVKAIGTRDVATAFRWTAEYMETGADLAQFAHDLAAHMRDMYVLQLAGADTALELTEAARRELESESAWFGPDRLANLLGVLGDLIAELKTSTNQRLSFEIALTRMVRPDSDLTLAALAERVEALERGMSATVAMPAQGVSAAPPMQAAPTEGGAAAFSAAASAAQAQPSAAQPQASAAQVDAQPSAGADAQQVTQPSEHQASAQHTASVSSSAATAQAATAQAGSAEAPGAAGAGSGQLPSDAQLPQFWATVLAHVKKANQAYAALLMNTTAARNDDKLAILFPSDAEFAFQASQKPDVRDAIADALAKTGAAGVAFTLEKSAAAGVGVTPMMGAAAAQPMGATAAQPTGSAAPQPIASASASAPTAAPQSGTSAPAPDPQPGASVSTASFAPDSAPDPDEVPLSAYDDMADLASSTPPWEEEPPAAITAASVQTPDAEPTTEQLNDALAAAFGNDVQFEPVD